MEIKPDLINHPPHYTFGKFEVLDVLEDWCSTRPLEWQVLKYVARAPHKGKELEDLKKAEFYLRRRIEQLEDLAADERVSKMTMEERQKSLNKFYSDLLETMTGVPSSAYGIDPDTVPDIDQQGNIKESFEAWQVRRRKESSTTPEPSSSDESHSPDADAPEKA